MAAPKISGSPEKFSPEWWKSKDITHPWCHRFCTPFYENDPELLSNAKTQESLGIVFRNLPSGTIVPVGMLALKGENVVFQYHPSYLKSPHAAISHTMPKREEPYIDHNIPAFFDNLPAEGWFGKAQGKALGHDIENIDGDTEPLETRYHRLMMFGRDCPGAIWVTYVRNDPAISEEVFQDTVKAALQSRATISGVQPKLLAVMDGGKLRPTNYWETSSHIVKLPREDGYAHVVENEYMSIKATHLLLPEDKTVEAELTDLHLRDGSTRKVLAIKRFDRTESPEGKAHFEELNQLLGQHNHARYFGSYKQVADFIREKAGHEEVKVFYKRLLSQFLLGNVDNHLKNFAMFHDDGNWKLTPSYDLAPSANYCSRGELALYTHGELSGTNDPRKKTTLKQNEYKLEYAQLDTKRLVIMGKTFGLSTEEIHQCMKGIVANIPKVKEAIMADPSKDLDCLMLNRRDRLRDDFCHRLDGRAQQLFGSMEKYFSVLEERAARQNGYT